MLTYVWPSSCPDLLTLVILPHLSWQTVAEQEASSVTTCDDSFVVLDATAKPEPETISVSSVSGVPGGELLELEKKKTGYKENAPLLVDKENEKDGGETIVSGANALSLKLGNESDAKLREEEQTNPMNEYMAEEISDVEKEPASSDDESRDQNISEDDINLLKQWSERQRTDSDGHDSIRKVSLSSDADEDPSTTTYHSYINYGLDDSDIMQDLTDPPHHASHFHHHDDNAHLAPIQESDETDEDEADSDKKVVMPSLLNSHLSAGMFNLNDISSDSREELDLATEENKEDEDETEEPPSIEFHTNIQSQNQSKADEVLTAKDGTDLQPKEVNKKEQLQTVREGSGVLSKDDNKIEELKIVEEDTDLPSKYDSKTDQLQIAEVDNALSFTDKGKAEEQLIIEEDTDHSLKEEGIVEQMKIVKDDVELSSKEKAENLQIIEKDTDILSEDEDTPVIESLKIVEEGDTDLDSEDKRKRADPNIKAVDKAEQLQFVEKETKQPQAVEGNTKPLSEGEDKEVQLLIVEGDTELPSEQHQTLKDLSVGSDGEEHLNRTGEEGQQAGATASDRGTDGRLKKGKIIRGKKESPIFLSENMRTFGNPISYLGGPTIEYDEEPKGRRSRQDSLASVTSLD